MQKSTYSGHRQFYLDRVAISENTLLGVDQSRVPYADKFEWWFQEFRRRSRTTGSQTIQSLSDAELSKIKKLLIKLPKGNGGKEYVSLGYQNATDAKVGMNFVDSRLKFHNLKNWILNKGRNLLEGLADNYIDEYVTNAPEF